MWWRWSIQWTRYQQSHQSDPRSMQICCKSSCALQETFSVSMSNTRRDIEITWQDRFALRTRMQRRKKLKRWSRIQTSPRLLSSPLSSWIRLLLRIQLVPCIMKLRKQETIYSSWRRTWPNCTTYVKSPTATKWDESTLILSKTDVSRFSCAAHSAARSHW